MEENPFADPFKDTAVTAATTEADRPNLEDFNPFADGASSTGGGQPAIMNPSGPPPPYTEKNGYGTESVQAPPVAVPTPAPPLPGHEELLRRQEELERKAEELQRREREMASQSFNPRQNNWPPLPRWCPFGPCFYQDFGVDIPGEFQTTVKLIYYLWIAYVFILMNNVFVTLAIFITDQNAGSQFGLAILWFLLFSPCSLCWYRPVYRAFRSDSSFSFFLYFFMMFFQFCTAVLMAVGIPGSGWAGWITAVGSFKNIGVGIYACIQAAFFSALAAASLILLKRVHSLYRSTGASFEKAQQEFAVGVMKNPGVQTAATSAAQSAMQGKY